MLNQLTNDYLSKAWFSEVTQYTKSRYQSIEFRLQNCFKYVTPHRENADVFSYEFASILRDTGSTVDSILRKIIENTEHEKNPHISDFYAFLKKYEPNIEHLSLSFLIPGQFLYPFKLVQGDPPEWWTAYNKVKHYEIDNAKYGNLKNAVNGLGAVAILYWTFFGDKGLESYKIHSIPSIHGDEEYQPEFFEFDLPKICFTVNGLPPHKQSTSIWSDSTQGPLVANLRRQALKAKQNFGITKIFTSNIKLELDVFATKQILETMGDIDNYIGGVCDGLMPKPNNPTLKPHPEFLRTENLDISPEKPILYKDDNVITTVNGKKNETNASTYYILKIYEL
jgi:hypothetical protein